MSSQCSSLTLPCCCKTITSLKCKLSLGDRKKCFYCFYIRSNVKCTHYGGTTVVLLLSGHQIHQGLCCLPKHPVIGISDIRYNINTFISLFNSFVKTNFFRFTIHHSLYFFPFIFTWLGNF